MWAWLSGAALRSPHRGQTDGPYFGKIENEKDHIGHASDGRSLFAALVVASGTASAYTLSFSPSAQSVVLGNQATVEVRITGILPNPPTIDGELDGLGNYDFDLVYDPRWQSSATPVPATVSRLGWPSAWG